jgi:hypothetical protein
MPAYVVDTEQLPMDPVRVCAYTAIFARMAWVFQGLPK